MVKCSGSQTDRFLKEEKGGVLILVAVLIVVMLGMTALAIDVGGLYQARREMVNAADSAALAGAQQLYLSLIGEDNQDVKSYAEGYAKENYDCLNATANVGNLQVELIAEKNVEFTFAKILGFTDSDVEARAVAKIGKLTKGNIMPFGISKSEYDNLISGVEHNFVDFFSTSYGAGNWGWVQFHNENKHKTLEYLADGYDAYIGMPINTNPGANITSSNNAKATAAGILDGYIGDENTEPTELWIPITGSMGPGSSSPSTIIGFAVIILEDYEFGPPTAFTLIKGRIISGIFDAEALDTTGDYSIFYPSGVALIE